MRCFADQYRWLEFANPLRNVIHLLRQSDKHFNDFLHHLELVIHADAARSKELSVVAYYQDTKISALVRVIPRNYAHNRRKSLYKRFVFNHGIMFA